MKANELRIGNLLIANNLLYRKGGENKIACVVGIDSEKEYKELKSSITIYHIDDEFKDTYGQWIKHLEPIPLTEEWLLKFGFENRPDGICDHWHLGINPITHDWMIELKNLGAGFFYRNGYFNIKYVHQIQNLYFALTNEELTMK
jgi:hypothetical protein